MVLAETAYTFDTESFEADFQALMKLRPMVEPCVPGILPSGAPRLANEETFD